MRLLKNTWKNRELCLMALPGVLIMILFSYVPMYGLILAFKKFDFTLVFKSPWCGFDNFRYIFLVGDTFWRITRNTIGYYLIFTLTGTIGNVILAIGINEFAKKRAGKVMQSCMILPTFISYIAVSFIVYAGLKGDTGLINRLIVSMGGKSINFYMEAGKWPLILVLVNLWKNIGYGSVLYLSVLTGIDQEMYEAADLDGANAWHKFVYITLPQLKPVLTYIILMCVIGTFQEFDLVYTMTNGGPGTSTYLTGLTLYKTAFSSLKMGYSCTMAVFIFILSIIISVVQLKLTSDKD